MRSTANDYFTAGLALGWRIKKSLMQRLFLLGLINGRPVLLSGKEAALERVGHTYATKHAGFIFYDWAIRGIT